MYPQSEWYLNDSTRKWVRKLNKTVLDRQIFPVYTSMESMTKNVHDLTVEDMKSITFQVIPSFYWKYEWTYNEFMIHPVGKLGAPNPELPMYDMLGNVWELVRDDWSSNVSQMDGTVNPIVGDQSDNSQQKVIKGGAFDQFCRKTISPSREGIGKTENKFNGNQPNVGFRPSLQYTHDEPSGFTPGSDPVDLFFLFDASASQNDNIGTMIKQAT